MENLLYEVWLTSLKGIGTGLINRLLNHFKTAENVYDAEPCELIKVDKIGEKIAMAIALNKNLENAKSLMEYCYQEKISLIAQTNPLYPSKLKEYANAPFMLYTKGNLKPLESMNCAAIVGARRCSDYGKEATLELTQNLVNANVAIISGMAKGIDSYAHTAAIKAGGYTVAIIGTGPERCYPSEHLSLMERIMETGAIISQFSPKTDVHKQNFTRRNELMAMLSDQVFVMEATKKSGALYTAECAFKYEKEVFSLPGSIYDSLSEGSNELIAKGASIYLCPPNPTILIDSGEKLDETHQQVCQLLLERPLSIEELSLKLECDLDKVQEILFQLEMEDEIEYVSGLVKLKSRI